MDSFASFAEQYLWQEVLALSHSKVLMQLVNPETLYIDLEQGSAWIKYASMIGALGKTNIQSKGLIQQGIESLFQKVFSSGEFIPMVRLDGKGQVFVADSAKQIHLFQLQSEGIRFNTSNLLAYQDGFEVKSDVFVLPNLLNPSEANRYLSITQLTGMKKALLIMENAMKLAGTSVSNILLKGSGSVAISCCGTPVAVSVTPENPLSSDPRATIAWSDTLKFELQMEQQLEEFFGFGTGEVVKLKFKGEGTVILQPSEELPLLSSLLK